MIAADTALAQAQDVARTILGAPVEVNHFVGGGCNSRIYKVRFKQQEFALKQYPLGVGDFRRAACRRSRRLAPDGTPSGR